MDHGWSPRQNRQVARAGRDHETTLVGDTAGDDIVAITTENRVRLIRASASEMIAEVSNLVAAD